MHWSPFFSDDCCKADFFLSYFIGRHWSRWWGFGSSYWDVLLDHSLVGTTSRLWNTQRTHPSVLLRLPSVLILSVFSTKGKRDKMEDEYVVSSGKTTCPIPSIPSPKLFPDGCCLLILRSPASLTQHTDGCFAAAVFDGHEVTMPTLIISVSPIAFQFIQNLPCHQHTKMV